jgi:hypothetical protein
MEKNVKNLFIFSMGAVIGSLITIIYFNKKETEWQEELEDLSDEIFPDPRASCKIEVEEPSKKVLTLTENRYKKIANNYNKESIGDEMCRKVPYVISLEQFNEEMDYHDKLTLTYYQADDTLVDEDEEIISDVEKLIGSYALSNFGVDSEDPEVVYVRNEKLAVDYEVVRIPNGSYSETVLGERKET